MAAAPLLPRARRWVGPGLLLLAVVAAVVGLLARSGGERDDPTAGAGPDATAPGDAGTAPDHTDGNTPDDAAGTAPADTPDRRAPDDAAGTAPADASGADTTAGEPSTLELPRLADAADPTWSVELAGSYAGWAIATDDLVVVPEQRGDAFSVVALERDDGTPRWRYAVSGAVLVPALHAMGTTIVLDEPAGEAWIGLDPETGEEIWTAERSDDYVYWPTADRLVRLSSDEFALVDPLDGSIARTIGNTTSVRRSAHQRLNVGGATTIELYDVLTLTPVAGPVDVGRPVGAATESADALFALDPEGSTLFAFDREGVELGSLALEGDRDGDRRRLFDVSDGEPAVLVGEGGTSSVVALVDGGLERVGTVDEPDGSLVRVDGRSYLLVGLPDGPARVVALPSGETTLEVPADVFARALGDGVVVTDCSATDTTDPCVVTAYGLDGELRWRLPSVSLSLINPTYVEGGTLTVEGGGMVSAPEADSDDAGATLTFHE